MFRLLIMCLVIFLGFTNKFFLALKNYFNIFFLLH